MIYCGFFKGTNMESKESIEKDATSKETLEDLEENEESVN